MNARRLSLLAPIAAATLITASCSLPDPGRPGRPSTPSPAPPDPGPRPRPTGEDGDPDEPLAHVEILGAFIPATASGPGPARLRELAAAAAGAGARLDVPASDEARALVRWMCENGHARPLTSPALLLSPRVEATVSAGGNPPLSLVLLATPIADGSRLRASARAPGANAAWAEADLALCESLLLTLPAEGGEAVVVLTLVGGV